MTPSAVLRHALDRLARDDTYTARLAVSNALQPDAATDLGLTPFRVAVLRDFTVEPMVPALRAEVARAGLAAEVWVGDFDTITRDALDTGTQFGGTPPDVILILRWLQQTAADLSTEFITLDREAASSRTRDVVGRMEAELRAIRGRTRAPIIVNTFPLPDLTTLGILDAQLEAGHRYTIETLNREIAGLARRYPDVLVVDLARLVARIGSEHAVDDRGWHTSRAPMARALILALAAEYTKFVRAFTGRVRKCLVIDCDDTLWGGIVGEDGLAGIQLDLTYPGSAYVAFQREILNLRQRGVLLAIVSKNNEADVLEVLREHPHMQIREKDLAAWRINWQDKPTNLIDLAAELNVGLDSLVFVDDSEFECDLVRARLPQVAVLHLGKEPATYATSLTEAAFFDSLAFSDDDRARVEMYTADRERKTAEQSASSLEEYLASLDMAATIGPPGPTEIARVSQLTQKTNQFNLTTIRYTEGDIGRLMADPATEVHALRLRDRFSELGLVGVAIVRYEAHRAVVDTLLMSCRVLGRGVEDALLAHIAAAARSHGATTLVGSFRPTAKNGQVASFYPNRGFTPTNGDNGTDWELEIAQRRPAAPAWIALGGPDGR